MNEPIITKHTTKFIDSRKGFLIPDKSVDLIITSPPYPMIEMWDLLFRDFIGHNNFCINENVLWEYMHKELDKVWCECFRVLKDGGFTCLNVGDAVRTYDKKFQLFPNHARVMSSCLGIGFNPLPLILWRKQTNAPNKFMGSGMLPAGAYVTMENEFILIFRKGDKRTFKSDEDKLKRKQSAFFWEERNKWFSDVWDFKGIKQKLKHKSIERSAAFPFELPYRLINMYSLKGETVLDPFLGTGTTSLAAIASCRNSIGIECKDDFEEIIKENLSNNIDFLNNYISERIYNHNYYTVIKGGKDSFKYTNENHNIIVKTKQETELSLHEVDRIDCDDNNIFNAVYKDSLIQLGI